MYKISFILYSKDPAGVFRVKLLREHCLHVKSAGTVLSFCSKQQNDKLTNCHCCLFTCKECRNHFCDFTQSHRVTKSQNIEKSPETLDFTAFQLVTLLVTFLFCKVTKSQNHSLLRFSVMNYCISTHHSPRIISP